MDPKLQLALLKRLVVESQLQSTMLIEILSKSTGVSMADLEASYARQYKVRSQALMDLIYAEYGGPVDLKDLLPPTEDPS